jgi:hypothetical protein
MTYKENRTRKKERKGGIMEHMSKENRKNVKKMSQ